MTTRQRITRSGDSILTRGNQQRWTSSLHHAAQRAAAVALCVVGLGIADRGHATCTATMPRIALTTPSGNSDDPVLDDLLDAIDRRADEVRDLTADFEQQKHTPLLRKPLVSAGWVRMAGAIVRWETRTPSPSILLINDTLLQLYDPGQSTLEMYDIDRDLARLAATPVPDVATLRTHFTMSRHHPDDADKRDDGLVHLRLTPRRDELKQRIDHVLLSVRADDAWVVRVVIAQADDERTVMRFTNHRANSGITEDQLQLEVPEGTRIIRPQRSDDDNHDATSAIPRHHPEYVSP